MRQLLLARRGGFRQGVPQHVQAEKIGGARLGAGPRDNAQNLTRLDMPSLLQQALGCFYHLFRRGQLVAEKGMNPPEERHAMDHSLHAAQPEDR